MRTTFFIGVSWFGWLLEKHWDLQLDVYYPVSFCVLVLVVCFMQDLKELTTSN